jgi:hypothetical protein
LLFIRILRNRSCESFCYEIEQLKSKTEDEAAKKNCLLDTPALRREVEAVKRVGHLHIPDSTVLHLKRGNKTTDGIRRVYLKCAGFQIRNLFPNNIVELVTGEIVYVEGFQVVGNSGNILMLLGRKFQTVSQVIYS